MLGVLTRYRDFRRLFGAELIVFGADWFAMVPLIVLLYDLTGQAIWGGLVLGMETGVFALVLPYAGTLADRFDRKRIMITANLGALAAVSLLFLVGGTTAGPIALAAVALMGVAKACYTPAAASALPNLVDPEDLGPALAVHGTAWGTMTIVGSSLGGLVSNWLSPYACFGLVGCGLIVSALLTWSIRRPMQQAVPAMKPPAFQAIRESLGYLRTQPRLMALVTVKSAVGLGNGVLAVFALLAVLYDVGEQGLGLMFATRGLGALIGPILFRRVLNRPQWLLPGLALSMGAYGVAYLGVAVAGSFPLALLGIFLAHVAGGGNWVMSNFAIQQQVPDELRGRVSATDVMIAMLAVTASQLIVGVFVDSISPSVLIACCGLTTLSYAVGWWLVTRRIGRSQGPIARPARAPELQRSRPG